MINQGEPSALELALGLQVLKTGLNMRLNLLYQPCIASTYMILGACDAPLHEMERDDDLICNI